MVMRIWTLVLCLGFAASCKSSSKSHRGNNDSGEETGSSDGTGNPGAGNPALPGDTTPTDKTTGTPPGPTIPEDEFKIPDLPAGTPLEGNVVARPGGGTEISGNIAGIWDKSLQPIYITGDVTLQTGKTLWIKEGVRVIVSPDARFLVEGARLKIIGTAAEPVTFTSTGADQTWQGIRICSAADCANEEVRGKLEIRQAIFEKARKADTDPTDVTWRHGGVFYIRASETILVENTNFRNNFGLERGGAVEIIAENPNIIFRRNILKDNSNEGGGGALQITNGRNLRIEGNFPYCLQVLARLQNAKGLWNRGPSLGSQRRCGIAGSINAPDVAQRILGSRDWPGRIC